MPRKGKRKNRGHNWTCGKKKKSKSVVAPPVAAGVDPAAVRSSDAVGAPNGNDEENGRDRGWTTDHHLVGSVVSPPLSVLAVATGSSLVPQSSARGPNRPMVQADPVCTYYDNVDPSSGRQLQGERSSSSSTTDLKVACFQAEFKADRKPALWRTYVFPQREGRDGNCRPRRRRRLLSPAYPLAVDRVAADWRKAHSKAPSSSAMTTTTATNGGDSPAVAVHEIPSRHCVSVVQERLFSIVYDTVLEEWLPDLILVAALEEVTALYLRQAAAAAAASISETGDGVASSADGGPLPPRYYRQHPSGYLSPPQKGAAGNGSLRASTAPPHGDPDLVQIQPGALVPRIKQGCAMAWSYYSEQLSWQHGGGSGSGTGGDGSIGGTLTTSSSSSQQLEQQGGGIRSSRRLVARQQQQQEQINNDLLAATGQTDSTALWKVLPGGKVAAYLIERVALAPATEDEKDDENDDNDDAKDRKRSDGSFSATGTTAAAVEVVETRPASCSDAVPVPAHAPVKTEITETAVQDQSADQGRNEVESPIRNATRERSTAPVPAAVSTTTKGKEKEENLYDPDGEKATGTTAENDNVRTVEVGEDPGRSTKNLGRCDEGGVAADEGDANPDGKSSRANEEGRAGAGAGAPAAKLGGSNGDEDAGVEGAAGAETSARGDDQKKEDDAVDGVNIDDGRGGGGAADADADATDKKAGQLSTAPTAEGGDDDPMDVENQVGSPRALVPGITTEAEATHGSCGTGGTEISTGSGDVPEVGVAANTSEIAMDETKCGPQHASGGDKEGPAGGGTVAKCRGDADGDGENTSSAAEGTSTAGVASSKDAEQAKDDPVADAKDRGGEGVTMLDIDNAEKAPRTGSTLAAAREDEPMDVESHGGSLNAPDVADEAAAKGNTASSDETGTGSSEKNVPEVGTGCAEDDGKREGRLAVAEGGPGAAENSVDYEVTPVPSTVEEPDEDYCPTETGDDNNNDNNDDEDREGVYVRENLKDLEESRVNPKSAELAEDGDDDDDDDECPAWEAEAAAAAVEPEEDTSDVDVLARDRNPYMCPSAPTVLEWLGRKTAKALTLTDVQEAFPKLLHLVQPPPSTNKKTKGGGKKKAAGAEAEMTASPQDPAAVGREVRRLFSPLDRLIWRKILRLEREGGGSEGEESDKISSTPAHNAPSLLGPALSEGARLVFRPADSHCLSAAAHGDSVAGMDASAFSRSWFAVQILDADLERKMDRMAAARLVDSEEAYRREKAWATHRFKGIHGGHAVWPCWIDAAAAWLRHRKRQREEQEKEETDGDDDQELSASAGGEEAEVAATTTTESSHRPTDQKLQEEGIETALVAVDGQQAPQPHQDEEDAALATALENEDPTDAEAAPRRRTTRSRGGDKKGGAGVVFYGNQSNLSQKQLMDSLLRLVSANGFGTVVGLASLVQDDSSDPVRRIRTALGRLVWKRNQLTRLPVQTDWTDLPVWKALSCGPIAVRALPSLASASMDDAATGTWTGEGKIEATAVDATVEKVSSGILSVKREEQQQPDDDSEAALIGYIRYLHQTEIQLRSMVLQHLTELPIAVIATAADERAGSMEAMDEADFEEKKKKRQSDNDDDLNDVAEGDQSSSSSSYSVAGVEWFAAGHPLLNRRIFRPASFHNTDDLSACHWYRILDYSPAVRAEPPPPSAAAEWEGVSASANANANANANEQQQQQQRATIGLAKEPVLVERRIRFRAAPCDDDDDDEGDGHNRAAEDYHVDELLLLTEAQVHAGLKAAEMEEMRNSPVRRCKEMPLQQQQHPFAESVGTSASKIMLFGIVESGRQSSSSKSELAFTATIVGHDTVVDPAAEASRCSLLEENGESERSAAFTGLQIQHRVLVLPDERINGNKEPFDNKPFWGTLETTTPSEEEGGGSLVLRRDDEPWQQKGTRDASATVVATPRRYAVEPFDYHSSSPAHRECRAIVNYLRRHPKSMPFMDPVDPDALGVPEYFDIIRHPMDISTLDKNLEAGLYSKVSALHQNASFNSSNDTEEDHSDYYCSPVARMLNGPFRRDLELIFDNAASFNPPDDWIHQAAVTIKKSALKKIEQATKQAEDRFSTERQQQSQHHNRSSSSRRSHHHPPNKTSIYVDEDSDVDMYEYESDQDDDYNTGGYPSSRRRGAGAKKKRGGPSKEDASARAVERSCRLQKFANESAGLRGLMADFPLRTDAARFSLDSNEWTCRNRRHPDRTADGIPDAAANAKATASGCGGTDEPDEEEEQSLLDELLAMHRQVEEQEAAGLRRSTRAAAVHVCGGDPGTAGNAGIGGRGDNSSNAATVANLEFCLLAPWAIHSVKQVNFGRKRRIPTNRLEVELLRERIHEDFYARLYSERGKSLATSLEDRGDGNADERFRLPGVLALKDVGAFTEDSFPPFLGRVVPLALPAPSSLTFPGRRHPTVKRNQFAWEIRSPYVVPALRWVLRGLTASRHLNPVEPIAISTGEPLQSGAVLANHVYHIDPSVEPFDVLDLKELQRRKRAREGSAAAAERESQERAIELSEYEKMRAERVARNAERLKALGLA